VVADRLVDDLIALAQTPAPTGAEEPRIAWLEHRLATAPGTLHRDAAGNLVWRIGDGRPAVALLAHVDTVFGADADLRVREEDGWLHGAGIGDNAAAVAVAVTVVEALAAELTRPLVVVFTVGEEGLGNLRGALHACRELQPEQAIALEGHGLEEVCVDAVGSVRALLRVRGPGGHSWWDRGRPSALHTLVSLLTVLLAEGSAEAPLNIGRVTGGGAINAIAAEAEATIEARSLDERALDAFAQSLADLRLPAPLELEIEPLGRRPAGRLDRDHPLLAAVRAARAEVGLPDVLGDGSTDANAALAHGIPALSIGCARGHDMHAASERIEGASLALGVAQLEGTLRRLLV
jgi:acetylornithine deacetylase/succinyl-diaminopimelate desuccinylase-like protein